MSSFDYPTSGEKLSNAQRDQLLEQVKQQVALASAQELIQKMSDKCFKKCINKPGTALDSSEQDGVIHALRMLLVFCKDKKLSPISSCLFYAFQKSRNIPRAWITLSCMENHLVILYSGSCEDDVMSKIFNKDQQYFSWKEQVEIGK